jgi:hypothetical protein
LVSRGFREVQLAMCVETFLSESKIHMDYRPPGPLSNCIMRNAGANEPPGYLPPHGKVEEVPVDG